MNTVLVFVMLSLSPVISHANVTKYCEARVVGSADGLVSRPLPERVRAIDGMLASHAWPVVIASTAFDQAWKEWRRGWEAELKRDPGGDRSVEYALLYGKLREFEQSFAAARAHWRIPPERFVMMGEFRVKHIAMLFDRSSLNARSAILAFLLRFRPQDSGPFLHSWDEELGAATPAARAEANAIFQKIYLAE